MVKTESSKFDYFILTLLLSFLLFVGLGDRPLSSPDEGRYTEIPREMYVSGNYVTPHLNGLKYFEKPPLVYWLETIPLKLGASSEFYMRLPIAIFALLGCLSCYAFGKKIFSRWTGIISSLVLGTSILYFALARIILLDLVFSVFLAGGLFSFIVGIKDTRSIERRIHLGLSAIFFACAVLTKGLAGLVLPLGIIGAWVLLLNKWKELFPLYLPTNLLLFCGIVFPWHILVSQENPEFFHFYFIQEHVLRYLTTMHRRFQPMWFFIPIFLVGFLPWVLFVPKAIKNFIPCKLKDWKIYDVEAFLVIWFAFIFVFFSASSSKLIPYILPVFFPAAIIIGRYLYYATINEKSSKTEAWLYFFISWGLAYGIPFVLERRGDEALFISMLPYLKTIKITLGFGSILFLILCYSRFNKWRFVSLGLSHIAFLFVINSSGVHLQKTSMKPFAAHIKAAYPQGASVVVYGFYPQDLPFYLNQTVHVLNWSGELDFGNRIDPQNKIYLTDPTFKKLWNKKKNICVVAAKNGIKEIQFPNSYEGKIIHHDDYALLCKP